MYWIKKYRFKTLEELEPYESYGEYICGKDTFVRGMYYLCGNKLSDYNIYGYPLSNYIINISEEDFIRGDTIYINTEFGMWSITYDMVINIVEDRKRKLYGLVKKL